MFEDVGAVPLSQVEINGMFFALIEGLGSMYLGGRAQEQRDNLLRKAACIAAGGEDRSGRDYNGIGRGAAHPIDHYLRERIAATVAGRTIQSYEVYRSNDGRHVLTRDYRPFLKSNAPGDYSTYRRSDHPYPLLLWRVEDERASDLYCRLIRPDPSSFIPSYEGYTITPSNYHTTILRRELLEGTPYTRQMSESIEAYLEEPPLALP